MSRFQEISFPEYKREVQLPLFNVKDEDIYYHNWPAHGRDFSRVLDNPGKLLGFDLEFDTETKRCSILGISNGEYSASNPFDKKMAYDLVQLCKEQDIKLVGFSINGAEKEILEANLDIELPLSLFEDTMILFYLCYSHLTKTSQGKTSYEKGTLGFINLWTCASILTELPMWKLCRELQCEGPCPKHDVFGYNAIDAYSGLAAFQELLKVADKYGLPFQLYRDVLQLTEIAQKMRNNGINVDRNLVKKLDTFTLEEKNKLFDVEEPPFNPNSPSEALEWFKKNKLRLKSFSKPDLLAEIKKLAIKKDLSVEEYQNCEELSEVEQWLVKSAQFKGLGKGFKAWFDDRYFHEDELLHPRFITTGASSGRWSSSGPNFQNIPSDKKEGGASFSQARKVVIPKSKDYKLGSYDKSQLELRCCLYQAGVDVTKITGDAFQWLVDKAPGAFTEGAKILGRNERETAKSVGHAGNYLEGITLVSGDDLKTKRTNDLINKGALRVHFDWEYCGKYVAFTGVNLAERLFGKATDENRIKAHYIQEDLYFKEFHHVREWHRKVLRDIEKKGYVQSPTGRFLRLYDNGTENAKISTAFLGQGLGADHVQTNILQFYKKYGNIGVPLIQVHDELVFEIPRSWTKEELINFLQVALEEDYRIKNFICPVKMYWGENWGEMERIY